MKRQAPKKKKKRNTAMYGISRVDDPEHRTHAWRVSLRRRGEALVRNFPDKKFGGKKKALDAAREQRDAWMAKYPPLSRVEFANARRRNNKSGVTGVCLVGCKYYLADGTERCLWYWEASWPTTPGNHINQRFSCQIYGHEKAFEMACRARKKGLREVDGIFWATERRAPAEMATTVVRRRSGKAKPAARKAATRRAR